LESENIIFFFYRKVEREKTSFGRHGKEGDGLVTTGA